MHISLEDVYDSVLKAENATATIFQMIRGQQFFKVDSIIDDMVYDHVVQVKNRFHELHYAMQDFLLHIIDDDVSVKRARQPRGAINFVGSIANTLFGTATQEQIDLIHDKLSVLESLTEDERRLLNVHSRILNLTLTDLTKVNLAITKLQQASRITERMLNSMYTDISHNGKVLMTLESLLHVQLALSTIADEHLNY